ncbi:Electron transport complex protein RnfA [Clostridium formicaceticum]|uniref:Ion-translocating oxidoreductase complex subunit A n=1 Tax=Clostridium formicaceticum TaxID=1497 RepID=A0AAC9RLP7_9CLOT|nr:Electron transport complex protein RnfA [Clostridium formicaceticum]
MSISSLFIILVSSILVNNFVLSRFLGICPFLGVSKQVETAMGMGAAVTFVMALASLITYLVERLILVPLGIQYMQTIAFILVIASLVQLVEMIIQKSSPTLYQSLGVFLPLITTNCAVLGVAILNIQLQYNLFETVLHGVGAAIGFSLAIVLFAAIRERLELAHVPKAFKGFPVALITASLMSLAFMGFAGLV